MASADDYSCINGDILVLTSVYSPDGIKISGDIFIITVQFLKDELCRKPVSCAEPFAVYIVYRVR